MSVFECVHLRGNLFRRIGRQDGAFCLKDNRSFVVMFVYVMDRNTGLPLAGGNDRPLCTCIPYMPLPPYLGRSAG